MEMDKTTKNFETYNVTNGDNAVYVSDPIKSVNETHIQHSDKIIDDIPMNKNLDVPNLSENTNVNNSQSEPTYGNNDSAEIHNSEQKDKTLFKTIMGCLVVIFFVSCCDYMSFGISLFKPNPDCEVSFSEVSKVFNTLSMYIFFIAHGVANVIYGIFSSIPSAIFAGVIIEARDSYIRISQQCHEIFNKRLSSIEECNSNVIASQVGLSTLIICGIATLLFGLISFYIGKNKLGSFFQKVPILAVNAVMTFVGWSMFIDLFNSSESQFIFNDSLNNNAYYLYNGCLYFISILVWVIDNTFGFAWLMPAVVIGTSVVFGILEKINTDADFTNHYVSNINLSLHNIFNFTGNNTVKFDFTALFIALISCTGEIISVILFNLIHINMNVPSFLNNSGIDQCGFSINREWEVQGLANMFVSWLGYPVYFVNCYSMILSKYNINNRFITIIIGLISFPLMIVLYYIMKFIPLAAGQILMTQLGVAFLYDFGYLTLCKLNRTDKVLFIMGILLSVFITPGFGFIAVIAISTLNVLKSELESRKKTKKIIYDDINIIDMKYVKINYPIYFLTLDDFESDLKGLKTGFTLDLTECSYIDMGGNLMLEKKLQEIGIINVYGTPDNIYMNLFAGKINLIS